MLWLIGGLPVIVLVELMWLLVSGSDHRKWGSECRKAENEGQAECVEEMRRSKIKKLR